MLLKYFHQVFLRLAGIIESEDFLFGHNAIVLAVEEQSGSVFAYPSVDLQIINPEDFHTQFFVDLLREDVGGNDAQTFGKLGLSFDDPLDDIQQVMKWAVQHQRVDWQLSLFGNHDRSGSSHAAPPNGQLFYHHIFSGFFNASLSIFGLVDPVGEEPVVAVAAPDEIEPNNCYFIFTNEGHESQTLEFTAAIPMQVQNGVFWVSILLFQYDCGDELAVMVLEGDVGALQGAALDELLLGAESRHLVGELVGRDDTTPCSFVELIHVCRFIYLYNYLLVPQRIPTLKYYLSHQHLCNLTNKGTANTITTQIQILIIMHFYFFIISKFSDNFIMVQ